MTPSDERSAWRLALALTGLNVLSYVDRQLLVTLAPLLMADLSLTRAQIGLLVGASFITAYAVLTLVLGAAADRLSRPRLIAAGLLIWSLATALTATSQGFWHLVALRVAVGVGEAALPATALAMLADRFPAARLGLANGLFYAGIPIGFAISFGLAGGLGPWLGWRACFVVLGLLGILAVAGALALPDSPRRTARAAPARPREVAAAFRAALAARPRLRLVILAGALLAYMSSSSQHAITWLVEERGLPYSRAALLAGVMVAIGGLLGNVAIGALADRWGRAGLPLGRLGGLVAIGAVALPSSAAFYLLPVESPAFLPSWFVSQAFMLGWFGPLTAEIVEEAPPEIRATVTGFGLMVVNLLGVAIGPWITGLIGDHASLTRGLLVSVMVGGTGLAVLAWAGTRARGRHASP
jgi:MFS transporter, Spinster family, sphingosine-1-phosphate transporter